jgi:nitroreductase
MEFKETVSRRRTVRHFEPYRTVEKDKIYKILEAARCQSQRGNAQLARKAVVVTRGATPDEIRNALIGALRDEPRAGQAPVAIIWVQDMAGWKPLEENSIQFMGDHVLPSDYGWSEDRVKWLAAFECGLAVGSALLAAVDEGLGTGLISGRREEIRKLFNMPKSCTPTEIQLVGYPTAASGVGVSRPPPDFADLYFQNTWGDPLSRAEKVVEELRTAKLLPPEAPLPWRKDELRASAGMFGLPE